MGNTIMIMAGGTGGHVYPALAVAQNLQDKGWQVSWLGTQKGLESRVIPEQGIEIDWLTISGLRGKNRLALLKAPFMLLLACKQAKTALQKRQPDVVLGMGGFVAGPGGLLAKIMGIPLIIHEQNRVPGTTNRLLSRIANVVLEAFPGSFKKTTNAVCTGNPLRKSFSIAIANKRFHKNKPLHILVVGGSLGAHILNQIVPSAVASTKNLKIKHQTGNKDLQLVKADYAANQTNAEVLPFIDDMAAAYQWADLIICRAGAMTISEIAASGLPSILIPYPYAIDDHQTANAKYLADAGAGILVPQQQLTAELLAETITKVNNNLEQMSQAARQCANLDATEKVAQICIQEAKQ